MLIDAHTHLDHYYQYESGEELEKMALEEICTNKIISLANSMDIQSYLKNIQLSQKCHLIIPCFGIHPWKIKSSPEKLNVLDKYIEECKMIGEIGLDFFWAEKDTFQQQIEIFEYFLSMNRKKPKIMNIHTKGAEREVVNLLKKYKSERVIIHWYSGPLHELRQLIEMGCYFTVGVEIKYSETVKDITREIPLNRLLLETDNPGGEEWLSKNIGMPSDIKGVYRKTSEIKNMDFNELEQRISENYQNL